ncbi:MAG: tetratricopeptide repeat protein [Candidatus Aminicenantia bacterium]
MKNKLVLVTIFLGCFFLFIFAQKQSELIKQGDELFAQREDITKAEEAIKKYREALHKGENNYECYWKIAKTMYYVGSHKSSKKEKKTIFSQGVYYAKKAVQVEPEKPEGHFWLGALWGKYGEARGVLKSLFLVKPIKKEFNKVLELDPELEGGGADRALGRVYYKVPGFAGGSKKKSLEHLLKSKEMCPTNPLTRIYLADTYLALKEKEKARKELEELINMEPDPRWIPETKEFKEQAKEMLKKIK